MTFGSMLNDTVVLLKKDGTQINGIKASAQKKMVFIEGAKPLIEIGDEIHCPRSNGSIERYEVLDPGFHEAHAGIPAHYQVDVKKLGVSEKRSAVQNVTYNVSGTNSRLNLSSTDNSVNISEQCFFADQISKLRDVITSSGEEASLVTAKLETVDALDEHLQSPSPNKSVVKALLKSLGTAANIATIGTAIIGSL